AYGGEEWAQGEWRQDASGELVWVPAEGGESVSAAQWSQGGDEGSGRAFPADEEAGLEVKGDQAAVAPVPGAEGVAEAAASDLEPANAAPEPANAEPEPVPEGVPA